METISAIQLVLPGYFPSGSFWETEIDACRVKHDGSHSDVSSDAEVWYHADEYGSVGGILAHVVVSKSAKGHSKKQTA